MADDDFYEEDEPLDKLLAIFDAAPKVRTAPPRGQTWYLDASGAWRWGPTTRTT